MVVDKKAVAYGFRRHGWLVESFSPIRVSKSVCGVQVFADIIRVRGRLYVSFPKYNSYSKCSHFAPVVEDEVRYRRHKPAILSFVRALHRSGLWHDVENKDFVCLNSFNKKLRGDEGKIAEAKAKLESLGLVVPRMKE